MRIALVEPYFTGSHAAWATEYARRSGHHVDLLTLPGRNWKWRMHGGAVSLAAQFLALPQTPDLILATDMLDLATFLALTRQRSAGCPVAVYFHENQLTYPWSPGDPDPGKDRDLHYAFINYTTALAADAVLFNSAYHRSAFLDALPGFLGRFPDAVERGTVAAIAAKSRVLPLGLDLKKLDSFRPAVAEAAGEAPLVIWNHRWEYDKDPETFFYALFELADQGIDFRLAVLGESFGRVPPIFKTARERLADRVVQWGYLKGFGDYARWLWRGDVLPVTSRQEFFGASVVQAMYCGCTPLLPDRLSYPEHLPEPRSTWLYEEGTTYRERLRSLLVAGRKAAASVEQTVTRYDWGTLAPVYDELLASLAGKGDRDLRFPPLTPRSEV
ncbi:tRNA-queuosine alpha-mannosyltransferase domain-containing protein [Geomesophilobacter sediminis]|uniref:tRNA-queuosine alpha-mannosyltransferase n=1 Tax=Geomesophilobacter sediminis TaxID=2798584 RepID=A0A8J7JAS6_9BACT|nr:DUF3524 domain-containing protein [Geomesophilobacter sediminis]MBJ6723533.1 DUF3524 domain-containing protein [Geomesophilobacter sediminis]